MEKRVVLRVENAPDQSYVLANVVALPPGIVRDGEYVIVNGHYVFTSKSSMKISSDGLGAGGAQREWAGWSLRDQVTVEPYDIFSVGHGKVYLGTLTVLIDFYSKSRAVDKPFEQSKLHQRFLSLFENQIFTVGQQLAMELNGINFRLTIQSLAVVNLGTKEQHTDPRQQAPQQRGPGATSTPRGIFVKQTEVTFSKPPGGLINLKQSADKPRVNTILQPGFRFEDMGIGGLDDEFNVIFRRAFASRIYPPRDVEKLGISHVKGMLLFGPPGTGKTLIARQIGKMLNAREPKIVNGPEMLSKYVGGSEENIRKLFKEAEAEFKEKGDESSLHIIIFDELDAVFKQRGSKSDGTGVGDNMVNQLLSKMDGVDQLNNILVIGMTNRRDLIDIALLRPGRFEVQLEISLPDEKGRRQILTIHTSKMRHEKKLDPSVNLEELASRTKNFSGAEIEGLVKSAASFALNRNVKLDPKHGITFGKEEIKVTRGDFLMALDENKPAFGVSEEELETSIRGGIIKYTPHISAVLDQGSKLIEQVKLSNQFPLISVLIHGPPGSGKTALASSIALKSDFPFIRLVSADAMVQMNEAQRVAHLNNTFLDAYKSPLNVLVIDGFEDIFDWVNIGPRFSNSVLQALKVFLRKLPPRDRKLIVLVTTCRRTVLEQLDVLKCFNREIHVPNVASLTDLEQIFKLTDFLDETSQKQVIQMIQADSPSKNGVLGLGIKQILFNMEAAKLSANPLQEFVDLTLDELSGKFGI